jgi:hypothetical protein
MAQTGFTPISIYYSSTATNVPTAGNLVAGELAINTQDGKLFYKDAAGVVQVIGTKGGVGTSSTTQVLYNSSGLVVGSANMTFSGTALTLANNASIAGLMVGKGANSNAYSTALGISALNANTVDNNTGVGYNALVLNSTGNTNTGVGSFVLAANTTGSGNSAYGQGGMYNNTTGGSNTAIGGSALYSNTTASGNTAVGYQAGYSNTTSTFLTALGYQAGYTSNANENTFIGYQAGKFTTGAGVTAIGNAAAQANTTGGNNIAIGSNSLVSNTTGSNNVAVGSGNAGVAVGALGSNTTGSSNTAVGYQAGYSNTTGRFNNSFGVQALYSVTTGERNNAFGYRALYTNTGENNTAIGDQALLSNTTANNNTAVGYQAGNAITTGASNVFVGYLAGQNLSTGSYNIYIGQRTNNSGAGISGAIVLGAGSSDVTDKGSNTGFISPNGGGVYQGNNSATWSITSDARLKKNIVDNNTGLDLINQIQVRNFEYRLPEEITELSETDAINRTGTQLGVIAQEIAQISEEFVKTESTGVMSVDTDNLVWYLINAVKELNAKITALENK